MKRILLLTISAFLLIGSGIAIGSSINGDFNGNPIVKVISGAKTLTDEVPAQIIDGKTMVPLTMLRSLGFDVTWNANDYSVSVSQKKVLSSDEIANLAKNTVGIIYTYKSDGSLLAQGSGFIISPNGLMVTNYHVIKDAAYCKFTLNGQTYTFSKGDFVGDSYFDVFGVTLGNLPGHQSDSFPYLSYTKELPSAGTKVYASGFPKEQYAFTEGFVTSTDSQDILHNAKVDNGSSGGALIDDSGKVIGITKTSDLAVSMNLVTLVAGIK